MRAMDAPAGVVIGFGYVRQPIAAVFGSRRLSVLGVDLNEEAVGLRGCGSPGQGMMYDC